MSKGPPRIIAGHANAPHAFPRLARDDQAGEPAPAGAKTPATPPPAGPLAIRPRPEQARKLSAAQTQWDERWDGLA